MIDQITSENERPNTDPPAAAGTADLRLPRHVSFWNNLTLGFAMVSPVVGLYAIMGVQTAVTGGGWFVALVLCLAMQLFVATVYAELASQFPIAGGAYKWAHHLGGPITGQFAGVIYVSSTIAMLTTTAYTGGIWLALFFGSSGGTGLTLLLWGVLFLAICLVLNFVDSSVFKMTLSMGVYAEMIGSLGVALLLFLFFRQHDVAELFQHLGTGTAPSTTAAFFAALAIAGWAFIGFDACSTIAEETLEPKRAVPRAIFFSLCMVGTIVIFNSAALTLSFDRTTLANTSASSDPITPVIIRSFGSWAAQPFLAIVMVSFLACGATVVNYVSRIVYAMAREGTMPAVLGQISPQGTPRLAVLLTVLFGGAGLLLGLNDQAVATIIAFGTGGLYAMFTMTTGVGLFSRLTGRWDPAQGRLKLGRWGLPINVIAFHWSLFELINIAWPRPYAVSADAPWWQLWAVPLVLGSLLGLTSLHILVTQFRDK